MNATTPANHIANPAPLSNGHDADRAWALAAIEKELSQLENMSSKINKPGSQFSIALLKTASIIKGSGKSITAHEALNKIKFAVRMHTWLNVKEIERQWTRAQKVATPRYRKDNGRSHSTPPAATNNQEKEEEPFINTKYPKTIDYLNGFKALNFSFRLNELDNTIEVNKKPIDDVQKDVILNQMRDMGLDKVGWVERAISHSASQNTYNPIKEYFNSLTWDERDHIGHFVENFLEETTGFGKTAFRRWFIGAVAKVFEQGQNFMMVWDGPQGVGKSVLARWLCPLPDYHIEGAIRPDDKDSLLRAINNLVWEVGELQATTRKADKEALKDFISKNVITVRRSYGTYDMIKPATASFIGTINEDGAGFLTDPTGSRRFVIVYLKKIRWDYAEYVDINNLWAQAVALYRRGEPWALTPEEELQQNVINERYQMDSPISLYFSEHYTVDPESDKYETVADIIQTLEFAGLKGNQRANMHELSRLMKKLGAETYRPKINGKRPRAYKGVINLKDDD